MNNEALRLKIASAEGILLDTQIESARLPAIDGSVGIHKGHADALFQLKTGEISYVKDGKPHVYLLEKAAFGYVKGDVITLLLEA